MILIHQSKKKNFFQIFHRKMIENSKVAGVILLLQNIYDMKPYDSKIQELRKMEQGTVGRSIANLLDENNLKLIPKFENHDLKHLILGYGMNAEDEVKMQAFLLGNGNYSIPCFLFLMFGLLMPEIWKELLIEFRKGKNSKSVLNLTIEGCKHLELNDLQKQFNK